MSGKSIASMTVQDILEQPMSGMKGRTERQAFELPNTNLLLEPSAKFDVSGSNLEWADPEQTITKVELMCQAIPILVGAVEGDDAEAKKEQASGSMRLGGLRAFCYSYNAPIHFKPGEDESDDERDLHDVNTANVQEAVATIRRLVDQKQMTYVGPALIAGKYAFSTEFPNDSNRALMDLGLGDGRFDDPQAFDDYINGANPQHCIAFGAIGFGTAHNHFVEHLADVSKKNKYFTYAALTGTSDPYSLALDLRLLSGTAKMGA